MKCSRAHETQLKSCVHNYWTCMLLSPCGTTRESVHDNKRSHVVISHMLQLRSNETKERRNKERKEGRNKKYTDYNSFYFKGKHLLLFSLWKWKSLNRVWLFVTPWLYSPWNSPGQNTRMDNLSLLQGIFLTQGSNPGLPHSRWSLLPAEPQGKPLYSH